MANRDDVAIRKATGDPGSCYSVRHTLEDTRKVFPERIASVWQMVDQQVCEVPAVVRPVRCDEVKREFRV